MKNILCAIIVVALFSVLSASVNFGAHKTPLEISVYIFITTLLSGTMGIYVSTHLSDEEE